MKCRVCKNSQSNKAYKIKEMMFGLEEEFDYFQCAQCECLQINTIPENIADYYPEDYYSYAQLNHKGLKALLTNSRDHFVILNKGLLGRLLSYFFPYDDLRFLAKLCVSKSSKILDVGCGSAKLLNAFCNAGFKNMQGIDPFNDKNLHYENGLSVFKKSIADVEGEWDLIMLNHSFEHMPNSLEIMQTIECLLSKEGVCAIAIPLIDSYAWEKYTLNWVQLDAPRHFYLHSVASMKTLAKQSGLEIVDIYYNSTSFQFWGSEQYLKKVPLFAKNSYAVSKARSLFSKADIRLFLQQADELNKNKQGDQAIFVFKKVS